MLGDAVEPRFWVGCGLDLHNVAVDGHAVHMATEHLVIEVVLPFIMRALALGVHGLGRDYL